jgi:hypothetical protein
MPTGGTTTMGANWPEAERRLWSTQPAKAAAAFGQLPACPGPNLTYIG